MDNQKQFLNGFKWVYFFNLIPTAIGLIDLIGWHAHITQFVQLEPDLAPMQYNAGLGILLSGLGTLLFYKVPRFASLLGFFVLLIGGLTLSEYVFSISIGLDQLFFTPYIATKTAFLGRMAPNTALCLTFLGGSLLLHPSFIKNLYLGKLLFGVNLFISLLSLTALFGYLIHFTVAYGWGAWTQMSPQAAIATLILGLCLTKIFWDEYQLKNYIQQLSIFTGIVTIGSVVIILLWQYMVQIEYKRIHQIADTSTIFLTNTLQLSLDTYYDNLTRMQLRLSQQTYKNDDSWQKDANNYFNDMPALTVLSIIEQNHTQPPPNLLMYSDHDEAQKDYFEKCLSKLTSETSQEKFFTKLHINTYQNYICISMPTFYKNESARLIAIVDMQRIADNIMKMTNLVNYGIEIKTDNQIIFSKDNLKLHFPWHWLISSQISLQSIKFNINVWPYITIIRQAESWFPIFSLIGGLCLVYLLALVIYVLMQEKENRKKIQSSEKKLTSVINTTSDAILIVDPHGVVVLANQSAAKLFGYSETEMLKMTVESLMPKRFRNQHIKDRNAYMNFPIARPMGIARSLFIKTKQDEEIPVEIGLNPLVIDQETFILCSIHNMSFARLQELKLLQQNNFLQMLLDVTNAITNSQSHDEILSHCIAIVCTALNWPIGHIFFRDKKNEEQLFSSNIWYLSDPKTLDVFKQITMDIKMTYGIGLCGQVLSSSMTKVVKEIDKEFIFQRKDVCKSLNLHSAFALPILVHGKLIAVAEFFSHQPLEENDNFLLIGNVLSAQIGHFIEYQSILEDNIALSNRFKFAMGAGKIGVWDLDLISNTLTWDQQMYHLYGIDPQIAIRTYKKWEKAIHPDDLERVKYEFKQSITGVAPFNSEFRILKPNNEVSYLRTQAIVKFSADGVAHSILGVCWDITREKNLLFEIEKKSNEFEKLNKFLEKQAFYDPLTGLMNRRSFLDAAKRALARAKRHHFILAFFYLDVDSFKKINDSHGHPIGDAVLIKVAKRITSIFRKEDIVSRLGGDEFVIIAEINSADDLNTLGNELLVNLKQPLQIEAHKIEISASIGIALFPTHSVKLKSLLQKADKALLQAKTLGKDRFEIYSK